MRNLQPGVPSQEKRLYKSGALAWVRLETLLINQSPSPGSYVICYQRQVLDTQADLGCLSVICEGCTAVKGEFIVGWPILWSVDTYLLDVLLVVVGL